MSKNESRTMKSSSASQEGTSDRSHSRKQTKDTIQRVKPAVESHPHSLHPVAPITDWAPDLLGAGFYAKTLPLGLDEEGEIVSTIIKYVPEEDDTYMGEEIQPGGVCLYIHGWNDYFFNRELAQQMAAMGLQFFAVDLRKYGRSLRPGNTFGYIEDLHDYEDDIFACIEAINTEPDLASLPLFLMGHSTGGLIATLFTKHYTKNINALILNSPWLETAGTTLVRMFGSPILNAISQYRDKYVLPLNDEDHYGKMLKGWRKQDGQLPAYLAAYENDPAVCGWDINEAWKQRPGAPVRAGWLRAITKGHEKVAEGLELPLPVLVLTSTSSSESGEKWSPKMRHQDVVLDTEVMWLRAMDLGHKTTVYRYPGMHDLFLSEPHIREKIYHDVAHWVRYVREAGMV